MKFCLIFLSLILNCAYANSKNISIELNNFENGTYKTIVWNGYPVFVFHLSKSQLNSIEKQNDEKVPSSQFKSWSSRYGEKIAEILSKSTIESSRQPNKGIVVVLAVGEDSGCKLEVLTNKNLLVDPCMPVTYTLNGIFKEGSSNKSWSLPAIPFKLSERKIQILNNVAYQKPAI
jgi:hypothetical protein